MNPNLEDKSSYNSDKWSNSFLKAYLSMKGVENYLMEHIETQDSLNTTYCH